jgi:hypothetical protein
MAGRKEYTASLLRAAKTLLPYMRSRTPRPMRRSCRLVSVPIIEAPEARSSHTSLASSLCVRASASGRWGEYASGIILCTEYTYHLL